MNPSRDLRVIPALHLSPGVETFPRGEAATRAPARSRLAVRMTTLLLLAGAGGLESRDEPFELLARRRVPLEPGGITVEERQLTWKPGATAIVLCDFWDRHWCQGATRRVEEMAPRVNGVIQAARRRGAFIVHAPSDCMPFYEGTPQRKRAREAPAAANLPPGIGEWIRKLPGEPELPIDDSDGGCDDEPRCENHKAWTRQHPAVEVDPEDAVTDSGRELWNLLEARHIENVLVLGVHTNMCVCGRSFALRQLAKNGRNVALVRDLTDSMYNPRRAPFVAHRRGTELMIEHIERYICPSVLSADLSGDPPRPRVGFLIGEDEYDTRHTLPAFAAAELEPRGIECLFVHEDEKSPGDFRGAGGLRGVDLLLVSVRRRTPPADQLAIVREHLEAGRPLVGIRTASHAFDRPPPEGRAAWPDFDDAVLGGDYQGHYGRMPPEGGPTLTWQPQRPSAHPILAGFPRGPLKLDSHLYRSRNLAATTDVLLVGSVEGRVRGESAVEEPVAWTNRYRGGRVFYTSLGSPSDLADPAVRLLLVRAVFWGLERAIPGEDARAVNAAGSEGAK